MRIVQSGCLVACAVALFGLTADVSWAQSPAGSIQPPVGAADKAVSAQNAAQSTAQDPADMQHDMGASAGLGALQIRGFNDLNFISFQDGQRPNAFTIGQLDLFLSSRLNPQVNVIGELVIEAGDDNVVGVDLERMLLQYSPNDMLSIGAGRYHTAIGYYNATYHHGNWFQSAIGRPFIFRFEDEGGILPVHGVGLTAQGEIPSGRGGLRYLAEVSNGRTSRSPNEEAVQTVGDENGHKAVNVGVVARPAWVPGLQAGFSVYRDRLRPAERSSIAETIMAVHVVYVVPAFEQLNEVIVIRHVPADTGHALTTTSFYTQVGPRLGRFRPYVRFEYLDSPETDADPTFNAVAGRSYGPSLGVRFDAVAAVALKLQYDRFTGPIRNQTNGLTAQLAFTF